MRRPMWSVMTILTAAVLSGCSMPVTLNSVQSFEVSGPKLQPAGAFNKVSGILIERGYDIKNSNKDAGFVTTEYKKFASYGLNPAFDYYLQIKVLMKEGGKGQFAVRLSPVVKEQNRLNAAAFTEQELTYYTGDPKNLRFIRSQQSDGWRVKGQTEFMNVVADISQIAGVSVEAAKQNVTMTPTNALTADRTGP